MTEINNNTEESAKFKKCSKTLKEIIQIFTKRHNSYICYFNIIYFSDKDTTQLKEKKLKKENNMQNTKCQCKSQCKCQCKSKKNIQNSIYSVY